MQQNTPDREPQETYITDLDNMVREDSPYTKIEWQTLVETPVKVGRAMIAVSPSGAIGMTQEVMALRKAYGDAFQNTTNPTMSKLRQYLQSQETMETIWEHAGHAFSDRWDATNVRQVALQACQQVATLLKKMSTQDAQAYKDFVYTTALKVAEAAKEGGFMGIGGIAVSAEEQSLLNDIAKALGVAHS